MLRRNMIALSRKQKLSLEDLLADLWHARRSGDLGRLAWLSYYEVRRWARFAGVKSLAEHASNVVSGCPYADRASYLHEIDSLILELEQALASDGGLPAPAEPHDAGGESGVGAGPRQAGPEFGAARH